MTREAEKRMMLSCKGQTKREYLIALKETQPWHESPCAIYLESLDGEGDILHFPLIQISFSANWPKQDLSQDAGRIEAHFEKYRQDI